MPCGCLVQNRSAQIASCSGSPRGSLLSDPVRARRVTATPARYRSGGAAISASESPPRPPPAQKRATPTARRQRQQAAADTTPAAGLGSVCIELPQLDQSAPPVGPLLRPRHLKKRPRQPRSSRNSPARSHSPAQMTTTRSRASHVALAPCVVPPHVDITSRDQPPPYDGLPEDTATVHPRPDPP